MSEPLYQMNDMMKKLLTIILIAVTAVMACKAADNAAQLLREASQRISRLPSVTAVCRLSGNGHSADVAITQSGKCFRIETDDMGIWYDGTTQWTWSAATNEVTVTEPTPAELAETNPLAIIAGVEKAYTATMLKAPSSHEKSLLLKPTAKTGDISEIRLTLNATTLYPTQVAILYANGATVSVTVKSITKGQKLNASVFVYNKSLHPGATINDLR